MTAPKTILLVCALFLGYLPSQIHAETPIPAETTHDMNVGPSSPGVCNFTSKYDGEAHKITVHWTGPADGTGAPPINLEAKSDGMLWTVDKDTAKPDSIVIRAVKTNAKDDNSAVFTITKKMPAPGSGGGKGGAAYEEKGYANQIQIHAFPPGGGEMMPRPTTKGESYYGILAPHAANQTTKLNLLFNRKDPDKDIGENTITLDVPSGVEVPGYQADTNHKITLVPGIPKIIEIRLKDGITEPQTFKLTLANAKGGGTAEDSVTLLPVEVVELSPKMKDENNNDIAGSEKPPTGIPLTPFVEIAPRTNKIAHRELKVRIGESLKGKKITWTFDAVPGATPATIRGHVPATDANPSTTRNFSTTHPDRFEASAAYASYEFTRVSQVSGRTTVAVDGHTAIRVNVPPIGFNQVRIKIQIEGMSTPIGLIAMEVPGVVVIDPGHGGKDSGTVGIDDSSIHEKDLALEYSLSLKQNLIDKFAAERHNLKIIMTRSTTDAYLDNTLRAELAGDSGADVFISIHFNSGGSTARGSETLVRGLENINESEDTVLAGQFLASVFAAVKSQDAGAINRGVKNYAWSKKLKKNVPSQWAVLSDSSYGQTADYHPIRGSIVEVEFLSHATALETVKLSNTTGTAIKTKFAADVSTNIYNNILNQP